MTKLMYMEGFNIVTCNAIVERVEEFEGKTVLILDQTCFYPKGGGQDFDTGTITAKDAIFSVEAVFFIDGEVKHIGAFENGELKEGDSVECKVDVERREINTKLHSAGHLIDMAVRQVGLAWVPGKGAHYPHMSFVEYIGDFDGEKKEQTIKALQDAVDSLIAKGSTNTIAFMTADEMKATGAHVPDNIPAGKPSRAVLYNDFAVPCGGTHVENIADLKKVRVSNIKRKDGNVRVSYSL